MKTAVAIRHIHFEDLGTIESLLENRDFVVRYVDATGDDLSKIDALQPDLLVVLGGPIGAFDDDLYPFVGEELKLVSQRLQAKLPMVGICLGAQLMARAMGAAVYSMGRKEIEFSPLDLTSEGSRSALSRIGRAPVLHWHGDQFDIPDGAVRLASTAKCPNQAFSVGDHALALQFHLEANPLRIERWLVGHASELAQAGIDPRTLRRQALEGGEKLAKIAHEVVRHWLDSAGL
ncbi:GMP synthase [Burkholderia sp. THE68]|uniref:glutamine amidotransferase n=1 Tax=Burkholderia sp. THE68 TaxID=758782 RepID=UPI00131893FE|nr:glutamine amidotransferase [Burkholderia sp. THE68]BBU30312.1 GMP synthase [Burkholderia sp. THE68]